MSDLNPTETGYSGIASSCSDQQSAPEKSIFYNEWLDHIEDIANAYLCDTQEISSTNNPKEG